jgi:hypothetical protein
MLIRSAVGPDMPFIARHFRFVARLSLVVGDKIGDEGLPRAVDATHLQHDELKLLILLSGKKFPKA